MATQRASPYLKQCGRCLKSAGEGQSLLSCAQCRRAWYCSKQCQRGAWPEHKSTCISNKRALDEAKSMAQELKDNLPEGKELPRHLDPQMVAEDLRKWMERHKPTLGMAAIQALRIGAKTNPKLFTHGLLFFVEPRVEQEGEELKSINRFVLDRAEVVTMEGVIEHIGGRDSPSGQTIVEYIDRLSKTNADPNQPFVTPLTIVVASSVEHVLKIAFPKSTQSSFSVEAGWEKKLKQRIELGEARVPVGFVNKFPYSLPLPGVSNT